MSIAILQALLSGLAVGAVYALLALGFSITYTTTKTVNFSHGDFVSAGAFVYISAMVMFSGHTSDLSVVPVMGGGIQLVGILVALGVMALMGVLLYYVGIRPFAGKPGLSWVVSTIGFGIVLQSIGLAMWGPNTVIVPSPVGDHLLSFFGARIRLQEVLVLVAALVVMFIMDWAMRRTILGKIMRAVAHSKSNATLMGINVSAVMIGAFAVSSALAALSGLLIAPIATASIYMGLGFGLKGFSAAIVGGLTNPRGCVIGGFAIGAIESLVNLWQAQFRDIVVFAIVILVLALRPNGLFGAQGTDKS